MQLGLGINMHKARQEDAESYLAPPRRASLYDIAARNSPRQRGSLEPLLPQALSTTGGAVSTPKASRIPRRWLAVLIYGGVTFFGLLLIIALVIAPGDGEADIASTSYAAVAKQRLLGIGLGAVAKFWSSKAAGAIPPKGKTGNYHVAFASDAKENTTLPAPFDGYRWTFLHANVVEENGQENLEMLTFIEKLPPKRKPQWWQITLPDLTTVAQTAKCRFENYDEPVEASMEWQFKRAPFDNTRARWALLVSCRVPVKLQGTTKAFLDLHMEDMKTIHTQEIQLRAHHVPAAAPGSLAICIAPLYGPLDDARMLEWRLHHAQLGVQAVHWYDRTGHPRTKHWVDQLKREKGLMDTWTEAPCVSPESCGTDLLEAKGVSSDQVLYYADCLARSRHTHPTEWLAMIDVDEFFVPQASNSSLSDLLSSRDPTTAMISFDRFQAPRPPTSVNKLLSASTGNDGSKGVRNLALENVKTVKTPQEIDRPDNAKVVYRTSALKLAWIHWEVAFRENQPAQAKKSIRELDAPFRLLHVSDSAGAGPFASTMDIKKDLSEHVENLKRQYTSFAKKLPWLV